MAQPHIFFSTQPGPQGSAEPFPVAVFAPGDLILTHSRGLVSRMICRGTGQWPWLWPSCWRWWPWEWPQPGVSHAMIVGLDPSNERQPAVWESTCGCELPCLLRNELVDGVQVHPVWERIAAVDGLVWHFPLSAEAGACYDAGMAHSFLMQAASRPYDLVGAALAADIVPARWRQRIRERCGQALDALLYCSELCSRAYVNGFWEALRFWSRDSQLSPVRLRDLALERGTVAAGRRVK